MVERKGSMAAFVKKAIAATVASKLREQPEAYRALVEKGLIDPDAIEAEQPDLHAIIRQFAGRISELARDEPSVMRRLEIRPLDFLVDDAPQLAQPDAAIRENASVVFCDLEGFTAFTSDRGDLEASALLKDHYDVVDAIVRSRGGRVVKTLGDGHMLSFAEPAAAVMAGVDLVDAPPSPLRLRAGAHTGQVFTSASDLMGHVVNVAARVTGLAAGGSSLVTTDLRDRAGRLPTLRFDPAESRTVPGLEAPVDVCEVHAA